MRLTSPLISSIKRLPPGEFPLISSNAGCCRFAEKLLPSRRVHREGHKGQQISFGK